MKYLTIFGKPVMALGKTKRMSDWALMNLLAGIKYKPDWSFKLCYTQGDWAFISIRALYQTDSEDWSNDLTFYYEPSLYLKQAPDKILNDIRYFLRVMEDHERDEFLVINGEKRFDPHGQNPKD